MSTVSRAGRRSRLGARVALSTFVITLGGLAALGPAPSTAATKDSADFDQIADRTPDVVEAASHRHVVVRVKVLDERTGEPARGRVWFVDRDDARISPKSTLDGAGRATVRDDPPPGTLPGHYVYRVRYGGSASLRPRTSGTAARFTIPEPPPDPTVDSSWADAPDWLNEDIGDVRSLPNWDPSDGNSWNETTYHSIDLFLSEIASRDLDAFIYPGDTVQGRWGNPVNDTGIFGGPSDLASMLQEQAAFYHGKNVAQLRKHGLYDKTYPAVGDHDLGDNWWTSSKHVWWKFKHDHLGMFRHAFADAYTRNVDGTPRFASRPVGSQWEDTAYSVMIAPDTLLVTLDVFHRVPGRVNVEVTGKQLRWLDRTLADARRRGVRWIMVQGHAPILPAKQWHSSGLHVKGGRHSALWQVLKNRRVNLYLAGEVHATSRLTKDGVTQIATGAPLVTGQPAYLLGRTFADRVHLKIYAYHVPRNAAEAPLWQGGCSVKTMREQAGTGACTFSKLAQGNKDFTGYQPHVMGALTVYLNGRTSPGSGDLIPWNGINNDTPHMLSP